ncbi:MAG: NUDIX domain-containing protein [Actinomycetota bacterium]
MSGEERFVRALARERRVRVRVVGICIRDDQVLCSRSVDRPDGPLGLPGGGLEAGASLEGQLRQEIREETTANLLSASYLFVVENRFEAPGTELIHQVEHYFEMTLDTDEVLSREPHLSFEWVPLSALPTVDLRPQVVRDAISADRLYRIRHLIQG